MNQFSSSKQGWFCFDGFYEPLSLFPANICPAIFFKIHSQKRAGVIYRKEKVWHSESIYLAVLELFLWVLECFNHSVKTMPCNLAGQKLLTQPTCYSKAGIHSFTLEHQLLKTGIVELGTFINMISKWSLCRIAQARSQIVTKPFSFTSYGSS